MQCLRWAGRVALVTGASSGIGAAVARMMASELGMEVVGCAPNSEHVDRIQKLSDKLKQQNVKGSIYAIKCDVSKEENVISMFAEIRDKYGRLDVCVNNAGLAHPATLLEGKTPDWKHMIDVNILGLCICTRESIKLMKQKIDNAGHIINLCSLSGHRITPGSADINMYAATKHAVKAITEGLRQELLQISSDIKISQLSLADVRTEFVLNMYPDNTTKQEQFLNCKECLEPEDIAEVIKFVLTTDPNVQVHDIMIRHIEQDD